MLADLQTLQPKTLPPATLQPATLTALKLTFPGSNPDVRIEPFNPLTTTVSYFLGNDPGQWYPAVQVYGGVRYTDLYPGVDLVLGEADTFWRLAAIPAAEANPVRLRIEGADGATLTTDGALRLTTDVGDLDLALPISNTGLQVEVIDPAGQAISLRPARQRPSTRIVPGTRLAHASRQPQQRCLSVPFYPAV